MRVCQLGLKLLPVALHSRLCLGQLELRLVQRRLCLVELQLIPVCVRAHVYVNVCV